MSEPKRVILLSKVSTYRSHPFVRAAERLGIEVIHGVDLAPALIEQWHVPLGLSFDQPEAAAQKIVEFAKTKPVQAVISLDDNASLIAAMASDALDLPHNSPRSALAARNKYEMRQMLVAGGVACPQFELFEMTDDPVEIGARLDYPVVVKPILLSGSRGVIRADNPLEFVAAFKRLSTILAKLQRVPGSTNILVESYLPGVEVALEGMLEHGDLKVLALFDKPDPLEGPFFEETIYVTPSRLPEETQQTIFDCTAHAVKALGLHHGPIHAELRVNEVGAWILEVAGRSIGGLCSETLQFGSEMSLEELILRQAVGLDIETFDREKRAQGVMMIPIPEAGIFKGVTGVAEAEAVEGIDRIEITAPQNYPLITLPEGESYLGFIFASGEMPSDVEAALRQAHARLTFQIEPMLPLL